MHEIILAMKTDIVATAGNKRGCYFTAYYITFCDYITHSGASR